MHGVEGTAEMANTFLINGQVLGVFERIDLFGKVTKSTNRQLLQSRKWINRSSCVSNRNVCGFHVFEKTGDDYKRRFIS